jgi:HlyD family secretion protein
MRKYGFIKKASIILLIIVMTSMTFLLFSCKSEGASGLFGGAPGETLETFEVRRGNIIQTVSTSGNVDSRYSNSYSLSSSGTVLKAVEEGDIISKGDILIKLESSRTDLLMAQAGENIKISQTSLELAKLSYQQALDANHIALQLAETNTKKAEEASASAYKALENANISASRAYNSAQTSLNNTESISDLNIAQAKSAMEEAERALAAGATAVLTIEQLRYNVVVAQRNYELALATKQSNIDNAQGSLNAADSRAAQDAAQGSYEQSLLNQSTTFWTNLSSQQTAEAQIAITAKNIDQAEIQVRLAEINYELLGLDSDNHILHAPYDGIVISSAYKIGELAGPGIPAVNIASSEFVIRSAVNETDIVNMKIGQEATITLDAYYNKELKGKILEISPVSSNIAGVVSYDVTILPEISDEIKLFHGLSASMEITTSFLKEILYVPIEAVCEEDGKECVDILVGEDAVERVAVETGIFNYDQIEIKSGLKEGDIVIVSGLE